MTTTTNQPVTTIRDGGVKAAVWANPGEHGVRYSVEISRTYRDKDGVFHDTPYLTDGTLLKAAHLLPKAYDAILALRAAETAGQ